MIRTDTELIDRANQGDSAAFEELVFRYDGTVLAIASHFTQNSDDAKDIYQETFLRVYRGLRNFKCNSEFSTWLYRITTNVCLTYSAHRRRHESVYTTGTDDIETAVVDGNSDDRLFGNEIKDRIALALQQLSPRQKMVFTLRFYQGYRVKDIAEVMECAEGTAKKYLFEATQKMRTHLHDLYD